MITISVVVTKKGAFAYQACNQSNYEQYSKTTMFKNHAITI